MTPLSSPSLSLSPFCSPICLAPLRHALQEPTLRPNTGPLPQGLQTPPLRKPEVQPSPSPSGKCPRPTRGSHLPADRRALPGVGARFSGPAGPGRLLHSAPQGSSAAPAAPHPRLPAGAATVDC
jgi:hypothetical protein